jgi:mannitol-1-phosphate 5-dehydrogenase
VNRVVIIGPGRLGCGYLTPLFRSAGWDVVLAARDETSADRIRCCDRFAVRITAPPSANGGANGDGSGNGDDGKHESERIVVKTPPVVAIDSPEFIEAVADADLVCTSVGVGNVRSLARSLARACAGRPRGRSLDVWTVENGDCAEELEKAVRAAAAAASLTVPPIGFGSAIANVAVAQGSWRTAEGSPEFLGDSFRSLVVDERRLLSGIPSLPGVQPTRSFVEHLHEKLYVFSTGHAICAYLGRLRGHSTIADAAADPSLRPLIAGSMLEARKALLAEYPTLGTDLHGRVAAVLARFGDRALADPIVRVAREPIRKLAPGDRLLGPAELIERSTGRIPKYLALAVAAALLYRDDGDEQSRRLGALLERHGVMAVLRAVCGLAPHRPFAQAVAARYRAFIITEDETVFPPVHVDGARTAPNRIREPAPPVGATAR